MNRMAPAGVTVHVARLSRTREPARLTQEVLKQTNGDLPRAAASLKPLRPDVVVFAHTLGSMLEGPAYDRELVQRMHEEAGCPALTTSLALLDAIQALHIRSLVIVAPYTADLTALERAYLRAAVPDVQVVHEHSLGLATGVVLADQPATLGYRAARAADRREADALFLSGTNWPTMEVIEPLEKDLGKPVLTANQVTLWGALKQLGINNRTAPGLLFHQGQ